MNKRTEKIRISIIEQLLTTKEDPLTIPNTIHEVDTLFEGASVKSHVYSVFKILFEVGAISKSSRGQWTRNDKFVKESTRIMENPILVHRSDEVLEPTEEPEESEEPTEEVENRSDLTPEEAGELIYKFLTSQIESKDNLIAEQRRQIHHLELQSVRMTELQGLINQLKQEQGSLKSTEAENERLKSQRAELKKELRNSMTETEVVKTKLKDSSKQLGDALKELGLKRKKKKTYNLDELSIFK